MHLHDFHGRPDRAQATAHRRIGRHGGDPERDSASFATGSLVNGTLQLSHPAGVVALVSANLYVIFFNLSWGPVMWILLGEMFPNQIRVRGWPWQALLSGSQITE